MAARRLRDALAGGRAGLLARLVAIGFAQAGAALATAWLVREAVDAWIAGGAAPRAGAAVWIPAGLLATAFLAGWLRMRERVDAERLGQRHVQALRVRLFEHLSVLPPRLLQSGSRGGHLLRFVGDLTAVRRWVSLGLARLVAGSVTATAALAALAAVNLRLGLAVAAALALAVAVSGPTGRALRASVRESRRRRARLAANVNEKIAAMHVVQVFGQARRERRRLARQSARLAEAMIERARASGRLRAVCESGASIAAGAVLLVGALEVQGGRASAGVVVAAMAITGLLVPVLRDLGRVYEYWHGYRVAQEKIDAFLALSAPAAADPQAPALPAGPGAIEFRDLRVPGSLDGVDARAAAGTRVAIVGPNGAGKSTLLAVAAGLVAPEGGQVLVDGHDLSAHDPSSVRRRIGMVSADLPLLRGSLERNLRYREPRASRASLDETVAGCGVASIVGRLPDGLRTRIADGGTNLSLGERQRVALARAMLGGPTILLLDEIEANLDARAVGKLDRALGAYRGTVLMVTHRPERLLSADEVWHVDGGRLVERGAPADLLSGDGPTARLFRSRERLAA